MSRSRHHGCGRGCGVCGGDIEETLRNQREIAVERADVEAGLNEWEHARRNLSAIVARIGQDAEED